MITWAFPIFAAVGTVADAPLDEAIIERHAVFREMSSQTQHAAAAGDDEEIGMKKLGIARQIRAYYPVFMRTISLKLPDDLLAQLNSEARARRITKSAFVRECLEKMLGKQSAGAISCCDLSRDLAGALRGLPKDLAENPEYMDGFGQ